MLELLVIASLSGDAKLCPQHAQRLQAIATALDQRPTDAVLYYWEATTWADCRQAAPAVAALELVRDHGNGFLPIRALGFERIWDDADFRKRRAELERALPRAGVDAPVAFRASGKLLIPEGIAYDRKTQALFLGSMVEHRILRLRDGKQEVFASSDEMDSVLGLTVDVERRRLYAVSSNGIASGPANVLFIAHATGIARIDVRARTFARLGNLTRETIAAVDGLYFDRGTLLGIQNATHPGRVIQISLNAEATEVSGVKTLLSHHHPLLDEPTTGALDGDRLLVLANSHIGSVDEHGTVRKDVTTRDPVILEVGLAAPSGG